MLMDVPLFWSSQDLLGQLSSLCENMCLILSCLPHVNSPAVFSCITQVLEDILCDQRLTSGPLDIVPSGKQGQQRPMAPPVPTLASPPGHCPLAPRCCAAPGTEWYRAPGRALSGGGGCG